MSVTPIEVAVDSRSAVVGVVRAFMISPEMARRGAELGLPKGALYFRGRSAVLGDPPPLVAAEVFGIFPGWLFDAVLPAATAAVPADQAIAAYSEVCWQWGRTELADFADASRLAELLIAVIDGADASALPLFAGWRAAPRPQDPPALLAHVLMVARELRGGLHFAALRASGLSVTDAVVLDPEGGRERLLRTAWSPEAADALIARVTAHPELPDRWARAEQLTSEAFAAALSASLDEAQLAELNDLLGALPRP